ncbi:MAG: S8 family serine peptidase [Saprospiraceae bacterium]|nr:S8 family serine peptidase [Saprospiraceae bacterium]
MFQYRVFSRTYICTLVCLMLAISARAQPPIDWHLADPETSEFNGIALERLEQALGQQAGQQEVIVAILDTGIDPDHEDLRGRIWINEDEVAGNGVDDDRNGYVDDIHGWNFLGGPNGENVVKTRLEVTRLYARDKAYFAGKDPERLSRKDRKRYEAFLEYKEVVETEREKVRTQIEQYDTNQEIILAALDAFDRQHPGQELNAKFLQSFDPGEDQYLQIAAQIFNQAVQFGATFASTDELRTEIIRSLDEARESVVGKVDYWYNPDFDPEEIIGDDRTNMKERYYGNNDTESSYAFHGTFVAGVIGARSDNEIGGRGICNNVKLMSVRMLGDGDEHDKDIANAIFYAVDNGASIINMSFGKGYTWDKKTVDKAVRYARKHDVLLVHAAGNGSINNDLEPHYPIRYFEKSGLFGKKEADNWIDVGALNLEQGKHAIAPFSHYGKKSVDLFAPGMMIYSTAPDDSYEFSSGTSFAAPVVAGVAALIRSHFPGLTAQQVRQILLDSATPIEGQVIKPGTDTMVDAHELSISGGAVNAYRAYQLAAKTKGKKKGRKQGTQQRA